MSSFFLFVADQHCLADAEQQNAKAQGRKDANIFLSVRPRRCQREALRQRLLLSVDPCVLAPLRHCVLPFGGEEHPFLFNRRVLSRSSF
jgi:hypothetical protein